jgi:hypothetical protein
MQYQCDNCQKLFHHPRKLTENVEYIQATGQPHITRETYVCPHCNNIDFTEYVEAQPDIISVKSVSLDDCDAWITQGYKVKELYAKTATIIKTGEATQ